MKFDQEICQVFDRYIAEDFSAPFVSTDPGMTPASKLQDNNSLS